ncbi:hypothetical protein C8R43DRAFT_1142778 [Mycena crocata]|nr:hypothetical protein C8R43DRAFT_1142778 [Mycena crocata]
MTHIPAPAASGTAPAVPVAANGSSADVSICLSHPLYPEYSYTPANTVAAIQLLTAAVASLAQAQVRVSLSLLPPLSTAPPQLRLRQIWSPPSTRRRPPLYPLPPRRPPSFTPTVLGL